MMTTVFVDEYRLLGVLLHCFVMMFWMMIPEYLDQRIKEAKQDQ